MKKISDEELAAACRAYEAAYSPAKTAFVAGMRQALEAARRVRKAGKAAAVDPRPSSCRFRLQDEGKAYPRSHCDACGATIVTGLGNKCSKVLPKAPQENPVKPTESELRYKTGDRVVHAVRGEGVVESVDALDARVPYLVRYGRFRLWWSCAENLSPAAKPAWNGQYEVGKSYRTRDGKRAEITGLSRSVSYPLLGQFGGAEASWASNGARLRGEENPSDLVGTWEE